jgi:hypothetical protein
MLSPHAVTFSLPVVHPQLRPKHSFRSLLPELVEEAMAKFGVEDGAEIILEGLVCLLLQAFKFRHDFV